MPLLTKKKPQIHENRQLLYHEDLALPHDLSQNLSYPESSPAALLNQTGVDSGLNAETIYQSDAPPDLRVVSWARGVPFGNTRAYAFDPASGQQSVIYIIENGIDGRNRVNTQDQPSARATPNATRNFYGHLQTGCMHPASDRRRQMTILTLMDLALHQRPLAKRTVFLRPLDL